MSDLKDLIKCSVCGSELDRSKGVHQFAYMSPEGLRLFSLCEACDCPQNRPEHAVELIHTGRTAAEEKMDAIEAKRLEEQAVAFFVRLCHTEGITNEYLGKMGAYLMRPLAPNPGYYRLLLASMESKLAEVTTEQSNNVTEAH